MLFVPLFTSFIQVLPTFDVPTAVSADDTMIGIAPANAISIVMSDNPHLGLRFDPWECKEPKVIPNTKAKLMFLGGNSCPKCAVVLRNFDGVIRYLVGDNWETANFPSVENSVRNLLVLFNPEETPDIDYL